MPHDDANFDPSAEDAAAFLETPPAGVSAQAADIATVLVVDDQLPARVEMRAVLEQAGYRVLEAADGEGALSVARAEMPDIMLLDLVMPGLGGHAVAQHMSEDRLLATIPVIAISSLSDTEDKVRTFELGVADYLTKPYAHGEVLARVRNQLRIASLSRELQRANRDLLVKQKQLDEDLRVASEVQEGSVHRELPEIPRVLSAFRFVPGLNVGGDAFQIVRLDRRHAAVFVLDMDGGGVQAAMLALYLSQQLSLASGLLTDDDGPRPAADVVRILDEQYPDERFDQALAMFYGVFDTQTGALEYCNAGHGVPMHARQRGGVEVLESTAPLLGLPHPMPFEAAHLTLAPGDRLFLFTDGIEQFTNRDRERFGRERLLGMVENTVGAELDAVCGRIVEAASLWSNGKPPADDFSLLALEYQGSWPERVPDHSYPEEWGAPPLF